MDKFEMLNCFDVLENLKNEMEVEEYDLLTKALTELEKTIDCNYKVYAIERGTLLHKDCEDYKDEDSLYRFYYDKFSNVYDKQYGYFDMYGSQHTLILNMSMEDIIKQEKQKMNENENNSYTIVTALGYLTRLQINDIKHCLGMLRTVDTVRYSILKKDGIIKQNFIKR